MQNFYLNIYTFIFIMQNIFRDLVKKAYYNNWSLHNRNISVGKRYGLGKYKNFQKTFRNNLVRTINLVMVKDE